MLWASEHLGLHSAAPGLGGFRLFRCETLTFGTQLAISAPTRNLAGNSDWGKLTPERLRLTGKP